MTSTDTPTWTSLTLEDAPALTALLRRILAVDDPEETVEEESMREMLSMPSVDLAADSFAVREGGRLLAFAVADVSIALDRDGRVRCQLMGGVDPGRRRSGLGRELFARSERRAAEVAAARHPGAPAVFRAGAGRDPEADRPDGAPFLGGAGVRPLLDQRGYHRVRSWLVMVRELLGAALEVPAPEGLEAVAPAEGDGESVRLAHVAAFADHWGSAPITAERWTIWWSSHTSRRELSTVVRDADGTVLAYTITSEDKPGVLHVALVGTRPEARGRGLARVALARTLSAAAEAGYTRAELEVDAESLTGATRLYDALGFVQESVYATYEKPVH